MKKFVLLLVIGCFVSFNAAFGQKAEELVPYDFRLGTISIPASWEKSSSYEDGIYTVIVAEDMEESNNKILIQLSRPPFSDPEKVLDEMIREQNDRQGMDGYTLKEVLRSKTKIGECHPYSGVYEVCDKKGKFFAMVFLDAFNSNGYGVKIISFGTGKFTGKKGNFYDIRDTFKVK